MPETIVREIKLSFLWLCLKSKTLSCIYFVDHEDQEVVPQERRDPDPGLADPEVAPGPKSRCPSPLVCCYHILLHKSYLDSCEIYIVQVDTR